MNKFGCNSIIKKDKQASFRKQIFKWLPLSSHASQLIIQRIHSLTTEERFNLVMIQDAQIVEMMMHLWEKSQDFDPDFIVKFKLDNSHFYVTE